MNFWKRCLALSILVLAVPALVFAAAPTLPDYEKGTKVSVTWVCDAGKTSVKGYTFKEYVVIIATVGNGNAYYLMVTDTAEVYFVKEAGATEAKNVFTETWDAAVKKAAPSFFISLSGDKNDKSDCKKN